MWKAPGINVSGYINSEFGLGEAVRSIIRSLDSTRIPYVLNNLETNPHRKKDKTFTFFSRDNPHPINLVYVNPDGLDGFLLEYGSRYFDNKYNIAFWAWELEKLPIGWLKYMALFDEIWTLSFFSLGAISASASLPVLRIPHSVHLVSNKIKPAFLTDFKDRFVFLTIFDFCSTVQRKNPDKVINAFLQSFYNRDDVVLVVKSINSDANLNKKRMLNDMILGHRNIYVIDDYLHRDALVALLERADCFVSMHSAEGFGLAIAEAMFLGKPVIATGYSANMEFMTVNNSFSVRYTLTEVGETEGPYLKGAIWAAPEVAHGAELMKFVYENPSIAKKIGERARQDITEFFSDRSVGKRITERLHRIEKMTHGFEFTGAAKKQQALLIKTYEEIARLSLGTNIMNRISGRLLNTALRWKRKITMRL